MASEAPAPPPRPEEILVPFDRVISLVRHLTHDARNGLNSVDLQAAYLAELVAEGETRDEVKRLRGMISNTAKGLQSLTARFWVRPPQFVTYSARIFLEDFRDRLRRTLLESVSEVVWSGELGEEAIRVDVEMIFASLNEIFKNAFEFREEGQKFLVRAAAEDSHVVIELRERKTTVQLPPEKWGREPLLTTRREGFGLGLFHTRQILALHDATLTFTHDAETAQLITRIGLPIAAE